MHEATGTTSTVPRPPGAATGTSTLAAVLGSTVEVGAEGVGEIAGVYVDRVRERVIGLEVASAGGARRFLPWVAARFGPRTVSIDSPRFLVDDGESYQRLGAELLRDMAELAELRVRLDGSLEPLGTPRVSIGTPTGTAIR